MTINRLKKRSGFSMIELIFVIIVLGIVASIGAQIIAQIYDSYILERAQHRASVKTELAATQIANRLAYAIPGTVFRRIGTIGGTIQAITDPLGASNADQFNVLQWVGYDADSFNAITDAGNLLPGWSGFCDLDASEIASDAAGQNIVITRGSNLDLADTIIRNLSKNTAGTSLASLDGSQLYFVGYENNETNISSHDTGATSITLSNNPEKWVEQYRIAWTSYALEVDANGDLILHYNFSPHPGVDVQNTLSEVLLHNVTNFKFRGDGRTIRFKICRSENIGEDFNVTSCKEKAVF